MGGSQLPGFAAEHRAGLLDLWAIIHEAVDETGVTETRVDPGSAARAQLPAELAQLVSPAAATELVAMIRSARCLLRSAIIDGDWPSYIAKVQAIGQRYADLGIGFAALHAMGRRFHDRMTPALVEAYAATPARLTAALAAGRELVDFSMSLVSEQLERHTRELESANTELEAFSYSVAHDLRAPLRAINAFVQIALEDHAEQLDAAVIGYLIKIRTSATRMTALIDGLLGLSRLSRNQLQLQPVDVSALARSVAAQLAAADRGRAIEVAIADGLRAVADPRLLRTALENLLGNAWKFTGRAAAPRITVGASDTRTFFVRDNGAGFDAAAAGKLFAPFERLHSADDFPGTGIGLATVQRIVHRHGGRIWADAAVGSGATFYFTLAPPEAAVQNS